MVNLGLHLIGYFTVVCYTTKLVNGCEAADDLVLI